MLQYNPELIDVSIECINCKYILQQQETEKYSKDNICPSCSYQLSGDESVVLSIGTVLKRRGLYPIVCKNVNKVESLKTAFEALKMLMGMGLCITSEKVHDGTAYFALREAVGHDETVCQKCLQTVDDEEKTLDPHPFHKQCMADGEECKLCEFEKRIKWHEDALDYICNSD